MNFSLDTNLFEKRVFCWKDLCVKYNNKCQCKNTTICQIPGVWQETRGCQSLVLRQTWRLPKTWHAHVPLRFSLLWDDFNIILGWTIDDDYIPVRCGSCVHRGVQCLSTLMGQGRRAVQGRLGWWYYLDWSLAESSNSGSKRITKNVCVIKRNTSPTILGVTSLLNSLLKICTDVFSDIIQVSAQRELWHSPVHWAGDIVLQSFR